MGVKSLERRERKKGTNHKLSELYGEGYSGEWWRC